VEVDEHIGMALQGLVDRMRHLLRLRAVRIARKLAVEVAAMEAFIRAHALFRLEAELVQHRKRHDAPSERPLIEAAQEFVDHIGAAIFVAVHTTMQPQRRAILLRPAG
jgi:hypothetical protein